MTRGDIAELIADGNAGELARQLRLCRKARTKVEDMLASVLDSHYGVATHHIGDGDGIDPREATEIRAWWAARLKAGAR